MSRRDQLLFIALAVLLVVLSILSTATAGSDAGDLRPSSYLFSDGGLVAGQSQRSDTAAIADSLLLPYWFWGGAISLAIVALLAASLRFALRR